MRYQKPIELTADVLVVGGGIAGAFAAIKAREQGADVLLVDKGTFGRSGCSALASAAFRFCEEDDPKEEWLRHRCGILCDRKAFELHMQMSKPMVEMMDQWGVRWVKENGKIMRVSSPGMSCPQDGILAGGGPQMMGALRAEALRRGVRVMNRVMINDLLTNDGRRPTRGEIIGAVGVHTRTAQPYVFRAKATVMCSGCWKVPFSSINGPFGGMPLELSGDGIAAMMRAGVHLGKMEVGSMMIRPTEFYTAPGMEMFTSLGARWYNGKGEAFMGGYDGRQFPSRSSVSLGIAKERIEGRGPVSIDLTHLNVHQREFLRRVIPIIMSNYDSGGYDISKDRVPYTNQIAANWGSSGAGARINIKGETSLPRLYGGGNTTDGGMRTMAQGLTEAGILGWLAGENAARDWAKADLGEPNSEQIEASLERIFRHTEASGVSYRELHDGVERMLLEDIGFVLSSDRLLRAASRVRSMIDEDLPRLEARDPHQLAKAVGLANCLEVMELIMFVLEHRKESRGNVYREDYPYVDDLDWFKLTVSQLQPDGTFKLWEVPPAGQPPAEPKKVLHQFFANIETEEVVTANREGW